MADTIKFDAFSKISDPTKMSFVGYAPSGVNFVNTQVTFSALSSAIIALMPPASDIQSGPTSFANATEIFISSVNNKAVSPNTLAIYTQSFTSAEKAKLAALSSSPSFQTAAQTSISDVGNYYSTKNVEFALQYIQTQLIGKLNIGATFTHVSITDFDAAVGNTTSVMNLYSLVNTTHTPGKVAQFNSSTGALEASITTSTELSYVNGVTSSIQSQLNGKLSLSGGIMTGFLTLNSDPTNALHAATKNYVDNLVYNLSWKKSVRSATVVPLPSYTVSVDFLTFTATTNGAIPAQDSTTLLVGDSLLIKSESGANQANQGIFTVTQLGDASHPFILTRRIDEQTATELLGAAVYVREGTVLTINKVYVINNASIVLGTTNITFALIAGAGTYTNGTYLTLTGNVFDINFTTFTASNISVGTLGISYGGTGAGAFMPGSIVFAGVSGVYTQDNANLFWNDSSNSFIVQGGANFSFTTPSAVPINAAGNTNTFLQINLQNKNNGILASTDWIATADIGTETSNYLDLGINGSGNTSALWGGALDVYMYASDGNLSIGTQSSKSVYILTGGGANSNRRVTIDSAGNTSIGSTSTTSLFNVGTSNQFQVSSTGIVVSGVWSGTAISISNGGSGQTTANTALNAFLPSQATFSGRFLQTDGANTSWVSGNAGTVTSVAISGTDFSISGSPVTTSGTISLTLATVNSNIGTFNNLTVNAKGLVTAASNIAYLTANQNITLTGPITGSGTTSIATSITNGSIDLATKVTGVLAGGNGGTGVNNGASTITLGGSLVFSGAFTSTITLTASTSITLPTSGTLYGTAVGSITSAQLINSMSDETGTGLLVFANNPTLGGFTVTDNNNIIFGSTNGTQIGTATTQKLSFYGKTPIIQPAGANQAAAAAQTQTSLTDNSAGTATTTLAPLVDTTAPGLLTAAASLSSVNAGWVVLRNYAASLAAELAKVKVDVTNIKTLQDQTRVDLVAIGIQKGSA